MSLLYFDAMLIIVYTEAFAKQQKPFFLRLGMKKYIKSLNEKNEKIAWSGPLFYVFFGNKNPQSGYIIGAIRLKHCLGQKPVWQKKAAYIVMCR